MTAWARELVTPAQLATTHPSTHVTASSASQPVDLPACARVPDCPNCWPPTEGGGQLLELPASPRLYCAPPQRTAAPTPHAQKCRLSPELPPPQTNHHRQTHLEAIQQNAHWERPWGCSAAWVAGHRYCHCQRQLHWAGVLARWTCGLHMIVDDIPHIWPFAQYFGWVHAAEGVAGACG